VPFAFAIGALIARRIDAEWIAATRRFALASWLALGIACCWARAGPTSSSGGAATGPGIRRERRAAALADRHRADPFRADPEKRGMLKIWNVSLTLATGTLAIVGTFPRPKRVLDSIHAFVEQGNEIAWAFTG